MTSPGSPQTNGVSRPVSSLASDKVNSLGEALSSFDIKDIQETSKLSFLEPRGLVNTGNMCYMNSVSLAVLKLTLLINVSIRSCKYLSFVFHSMHS